MRTLIASGTGRYADPWHPFPATSPLIADILTADGFEVEIDPDVDRAMTRLDDVDLLIVNAGDPWREGGSRLSGTTPSIDGFAAALDRGIGVIAMHCALSTLRDYPEWAPAIGAMWVPGLSFHPPADTTVIRRGPVPGSSVAPVDFEVFDERYCGLQRLARFEPVAWHDNDADALEPTAWVRQHGASRLAVDALGHDERSYESEGHRTLLRELAHWVTAGGRAR